MFEGYEFRLEYGVDGIDKVAKGAECEDFAVEIARTERSVRCALKPKRMLSLKRAHLEGKREYGADDRVFANGYQSWTTSREYRRNDVQVGLRGLGRLPLARGLIEIMGDYSFAEYSKRPGKFHSYSYTYVKSGGKIELLGSLCERTGFTVFYHDMNANALRATKDVEGVETDEEYVVFELFRAEGGYDEAFDAYFAKLGVPKPRLEHLAGYTSWYNYYGRIDEEIALRDLKGLAELGDKADVFQIDDGYQTKVGDWQANEKFPHGMKYVADKIHEAGYKAGLWMAPFNAAFDSKVAREHRDWLVKKPGTNRVQLGVIGWGGGGTIDFCVPEAAEYLRGVFDRVVNEWGFDMVKLDFLYSACYVPRCGKSRGRLMCEAMDFLRECAGEKTLILGCGVPLFPAFGVVDACRIGCDVSAKFENDLLEKNTGAEIISARNAMNNSVFRRHLNGRAFVNDPDVFYLRRNNLKGIDPLYTRKGRLEFTDGQKALLAEINNMCGDVLFVSDCVGLYDEERRKLAERYLGKTERKVIDARYVDDSRIELEYEERGTRHTLEFDLVTGESRRVARE